jgi:RimJ/RimL family protein N-acetyltransferase
VTGFTEEGRQEPTRCFHATSEEGEVEFPFLIGEKVYLRPVELEDVDRFVRWFNDPEVRATLSTSFPLSRLREREFVESLYKEHSDVVLAIVIREGDAHIGVAGLHGIKLPNRNATFGIAIGEKASWDKGYGTEATRLMLDYGFRTLNLHRVTLWVYDTNPRAIHVYQKLGFREEGRKRESEYRDGKYRDDVLMGILEREWKGS